MSAEESFSEVLEQPPDRDQRIVLANRLYRDFHTQCFWHCPRDLRISAELIPHVVQGLRRSGGRAGFLLAAQLLAGATPLPTEPEECH
jgi:hypothetical protein